MKKLIIGVMLLTTSVFATINGLKEELVVSNYIDSIGGFPLKIDKYMMQIDMFIKRTKDEKVSLVNVYSLKSNIKFNEEKLFGAYKESMKETYCRKDSQFLFGNDGKITIEQKYVFRGEIIKTLKLNKRECK